MTASDRTQLSNAIKALKSLIADNSSAAGVIEQKTNELKSITDMIVLLYTPDTET